MIKYFQLLKKISLLCLFLSAVGCQITAQPANVESNKNNDFYKRQEVVYQEWLDQTGLGKVIRVQETEVREDSVDLYLSIYNPKPSDKGEDSAGHFFANFRHARKKFNAKSPLGLEQQLFVKLLQIMEVPPQKATVQLYDTYDLSKPVLGFYGIYYDNQKILVDSSGFKGTSHIVPISIAVKDSADSDDRIERAISPAKAFECIDAFFRDRFSHQQSTNDCSVPNVEIISYPIGESGLFVEAVPLCKEVLQDQNDPAICDWLRRLGFDCSTIKQERLTYVFSIVPTKNSHKLFCYIDGKCKSQEWLGGTEYKVIDHDPASDKILRDYGSELLKRLTAYISRCN